VDVFSNNRRKRDGLEPWCKQCERVRKGAQPRQIDPAPPGSKTCATCKAVKPLTAFYAEREGRGSRGVAGSCKACRLAKDDKRRRVIGVPERPRYDDPPGFKTCRRCRQQQPILMFVPEPRNTTDGLNSWCTKCVRERTLEWHRANPTVIQALSIVRRTAEELGPFDTRDWARLCDRWGCACAYCGARPRTLSLDHIIPLTRGGRHTIGNLLPSCRSCNSSKGNKLLATWRYRTRRVRRPGAVGVILPPDNAR
jgi:5-methylcytosine-specific restriction endonuclease McrA